MSSASASAASRDQKSTDEQIIIKRSRSIRKSKSQDRFIFVFRNQLDWWQRGSDVAFALRTPQPRVRISARQDFSVKRQDAQEALLCQCPRPKTVRVVTDLEERPKLVAL